MGIRWSMGFTSSSSVLYVFGGRDQPIVNGKTTVNSYGDFHQFDLETRAWTRLDSAANVAGTPPSARETVGFSVLGGSLIVLGGTRYSMNGNAFRYEFTTRTWSAVNPPYPLQGSTESGQTVLNDKLFIHMSSRYSGGPKNTILVLQLNSAELQWTEIDPGSMQGSILRCERECALSVFGGNLVQYDGYTQSPTVYYQDVHILRPSMNTWFTATNPTEEIPDVTFAFGDLGTIGNSMFVFGGNNKGLYRYDMPPDCSDVPSAGPCLARCNTGGIAGLGALRVLPGPMAAPACSVLPARTRLRRERRRAPTALQVNTQRRWVLHVTCARAARPTPTHLRQATRKQTARATRARRASTAEHAHSVSRASTRQVAGTPTVRAAQSILTRPSGASFLQHAHATPDPQGWVAEYAPSASREPTLQTAGMKTVQAARQMRNSPAGSSMVTACTCNAGSLGPDGELCTKCVKGTYKAGRENANCESCSANSNSPVGSSLVAQCACNAGFSNGIVLGTCMACIISTYKAEAWEKILMTA